MKNLFICVKTLLFGGLILFIWGYLSLSTRYFDRLLEWGLPQWTFVPGVIMLITGGTIVSMTAFLFVFSGKGTPAPFDAPKEFVSVGPYRFVRNPMYIGGFLLFEGFAFVNLSVFMTIFPFIWLLIVHLMVVLHEEKTLEKQFGDTYLNYKKVVNRWIPSFKKMRS
jgi:protein-S-isoprenylcysteine O-methyltransferase Ste14